MIYPVKTKRKDDSHLHQITLDPRRDAPLYAQVRNALENLIDAEFNPGDEFYPEKVLVEKLAVSRITVRRALGDLRLAGRLSSSRGAATIVSGPNVPQTLNRRSALDRAFRQNEPTKLASNFQLEAVSVITSMQYSESQASYLAAASEECAARQLKFHIYNVAPDELMPAYFDTATLGPTREGVFLYRGSDVTTRMFLNLRDRGYRTVAIDGVPAGYPGRVVVTDSEGAIRLGLDHLFSLGHQRITLLVNEPLRHLSVSTKVEAFQRIMHDRGFGHLARVVACAVGTFDGSYASAYGHMGDVWSGKPGERPTAIFAVSDPGAWAAVRWLTERDFSVPGDVSVLGFEDAESSRYIVPSISSVAHPRANIIRRALDVLSLENFDYDCTEMIEPHLVNRESTGQSPER